MALHLRALKLDAGMVREHRFHPKRRWKFDFAWPAQRVALETEGGVWTGGRHTTGTGFIADAEKYNTATVLGWRVFRVAPCHVKSGEAAQWIAAALNQPAQAYVMECP